MSDYKFIQISTENLHKANANPGTPIAPAIAPFTLLFSHTPVGAAPADDVLVSDMDVDDDLCAIEVGELAYPDDVEVELLKTPDVMAVAVSTPVPTAVPGLVIVIELIVVVYEEGPDIVVFVSG